MVEVESLRGVMEDEPIHCFEMEQTNVFFSICLDPHLLFSDGTAFFPSSTIKNSNFFFEKYPTKELRSLMKIFLSVLSDNWTWIEGNDASHCEPSLIMYQICGSRESHNVKRRKVFKFPPPDIYSEFHLKFKGCFLSNALY